MRTYCPLREAEFSMIRRVGAPEEHVLAVQGNLATYHTWAA